MKSHRVAITGVSGDVGYGAVKGLRVGYPLTDILGLDSSYDRAAYSLCDRYEVMPRVDSDAYVSSLKSALSKHKIELLIPGIDSELEILSKNREEIERDTQASILLCDENSLLKCVDKYETAVWLHELGLPALHTINSSDIPDTEREEFVLNEFQGEFPIVIKPRKGHGSVGIRYVETIDELKCHLQTLALDDCLQEYVDGDEITCGLLFDQQGNLADSLAMKRTLENGRTVSASVYENSQLDEYISLFAEKTKLIGPINLQLRINQAGQPRVFEINPRLSGSTLMRIAVGFNDPARIVEHFLDGLPIRRANVKKSKVYRIDVTDVPGESEIRLESK
ncbi:MAG: ATP-grasp domain-containing protein [Planctomycetes bacterium]|uniref:ATP-grasp domain-containing protein n=1 Tax=uncultured Gimesia sp. TaxID=1678688 RepID=UPI002612A2D1|nr:ATP-grasp domain-containing protein [uncultured Gimesia sp.]MCH9656602.1 ATP-grasp domain-containing protein [Planctomycetota bacterium]MCH9727644.1 ATP-grasp domain-containing protein [Planctomycetota bacterium]MCH9779127.1 ATP-grasp domain-containing protein [Planctomycetota bacterium]